jgi:hypothetical protein
VKSKLTLALVFAAGLALGVVISPIRYHLEPVGSAFAYRIDRLTGAVDFIDATHSRRIKPAPGPLAHLSDQELLDLAKKARK